MIDSVYIHIPFCKHICTYCDFCKMLYIDKLSDKYFDVLKDEINDRYSKEIINTIYIGGGTPSVLSQKDLSKLKEVISLFKRSDNCEFTFECNIYDINEELLDYLKSIGVNRLSIGIESFDQANLSLMERKNTFKDTERKIKLARLKGFNNINLDLIYALPHEAFNVLKKDLKLLLKLNPEHISTYSLILENNTMLKIKGYENIDEELDYKMYSYIIKKLAKYNYSHYEISNFAKKGYESKHNVNCWNNLEYYGFGLGAAGYYAGVRYENTRSLNKYLNHDYSKDKEIVSKDSMMKYELMLGLRKTMGINMKDFYSKYNISLTKAFDFEKVLKNKDVIIKNEYLFINPKKLYLMNEILLKII